MMSKPSTLPFDASVQRHGPPIHQAFTVMHGLAVIATLHGYSVVIPVHGTWPGQLDDPLHAHVQPTEVFLTPDATVRSASTAEQQQGIALVTAQALSSISTLPDRVRLLDQLSGPMNQTTHALCVGSTRTAVAAAGKSARRNRAQLSDLPRSERRPRTPRARPFACERFCVTRALLMRLVEAETPIAPTPVQPERLAYGS